MTFTAAQQQAIESGEAVPLTVGQTECVVIRRDLYERVRAVLYDESEWTDEELSRLAARTFQDADSAGPID